MNSNIQFMTKYILFILSIFFMCFTACSIKTDNKNTIDFNAEFPLSVPVENSILSTWGNKTVRNSILIDDMETEGKWLLSGVGEMEYTQDRAIDEKQSLRFRTFLRDTVFYSLAENRTPWGSFSGEQGGYSSIKKIFTEPQDWSAFNRLSFWVYIHPNTMPTYSFFLEIGNKGTNYDATTSRRDHFIQDLEPGKWHRVYFEIPHIKRDSIVHFSIKQTLIGHNPEDNGIVTYDFDRIELQSVDADQYEGWEVAPAKFSFSHIGYRPEDEKIAMVGAGYSRTFQLMNENNKVVYEGEVKSVENKNGVFNLLDFSGFREEGIFRIKTGPLHSGPFPINEDVWLNPVFSALNFYYCQRCGHDIPGIHSVCHKDWQGFHGDEKKVINGGWHDAGDLSQGHFRTAMGVYALLSNIENLESRKDLGTLTDRMKSEAKWGLDWLLKTRFADGYHMSWSTMRIYTDNKIGTIDDNISPAKNVPWENFLAAATQCKAYQVFKGTDEELAQEALKAAVEDWQYAIDSRKEWIEAEYREAAWGVISSVSLYQLTKEEKYKEYAIRLGKLLIQCQEQTFIERIPITGFFYTDTGRKQILQNFHSAFEEAPMIALNSLCKEFPEESDWIEWYNSATLYSEYFLKKGSKIAEPYYLLPNAVYRKSDILADTDNRRRESSLRQYNDGTQLNENYALRTFPIWENDLFHGATSIHLSKTWALAQASDLRNDKEGMQLVGKQLNWILGDNPFSQSLMYGVGYDFAPQFAYCLKDIVGSLPVGMDCMSGDQPYWSASNYATYKEIWIEPVNRFLGTVSVHANTSCRNKEIQIEADVIKEEGLFMNTSLRIKGKGLYNLEVKAWNVTSDLNELQVDLQDGKETILPLRFKVIDASKPYTIVIREKEEKDVLKEMTGKK